MGVIHTESWQRFSVSNFTGDATNASINIKGDPSYTIRAGRYTYGLLESWTDAQMFGYATWAIVQDPVEPSKHRMGFGTTALAAQYYAYAFDLGRPFQTPKDHYFVGFLVRCTSSGGSSPTAMATALCFTTLASGMRGTSSQYPALSYAIPYVGGVYPVPFALSDYAGANFIAGGSAVSTALSVPPRVFVDGVESSGSAVSIQKDYDHYVEIEVDVTNQLINVWVDEILAAQPVWQDAFNDFANGFCIRYCRGSSSNAGNTIRGYYVSDMYVIDAEDGVAPTGRLGASTRVIGELPDTDIDVEFSRPDGYDSNAEVVGTERTTQATPSVFLTGDGAGTQDLYSKAGSTIGQAAAIVYAVNVRSEFANGALASHTMAAVIGDGTNTAEQSYGTLANSDGWVSRNGIFHTDPSGAAWTPGSAGATYFGFKVVS